MGVTWKHGAWKSVVSVCVVGTGGALGSVLSSVATGSVLLCLPGSIRRYSCPPSGGKSVLLWVGRQSGFCPQDLEEQVGSA